MLPAEATVGEALADDDLIERVRGAEEARGRSVEDARDEGLGFDAVARDADGQDVRFLLARRVDADSKLWLRASEWSPVQHLGDHVLLYAGLGAQLVMLSAKDAALAATADDQHCRVSIRLAELQLPLATPSSRGSQ